MFYPHADSAARCCPRADYMLCCTFLAAHFCTRAHYFAHLVHVRPVYNFILRFFFWVLLYLCITLFSISVMHIGSYFHFFSHYCYFHSVHVRIVQTRLHDLDQNISIHVRIFTRSDHVRTVARLVDFSPFYCLYPYIA